MLGAPADYGQGLLDGVLRLGGGQSTQIQFQDYTDPAGRGVGLPTADNHQDE